MNNNTYSYEKLELVRLLRQKTQKEVAQAVGITQSSLSKAEHGLYVMPAEELDKLCHYYDVPLDFLTSSDVIFPTGHFYYRRRLTIPNKTIDSFIAKVQIFKAIIDNLMKAVDLPDYTFESYKPDIENLSPKEIAQKIRYSLGVLHGPVPNLSTLLENNGIIIIGFDFGTDKIDGVTAITNENRKLMFINNRMPNDRIRFSVAHELGHLVMHVPYPPIDIEIAEQQADEFASEFLMPENEIRPMLSGLSLQTLSILKKRWRVSMHALVRRAKDLGVISYQQYRSIQVYFSKKGFTKSEPFPLPVEKPTMLEEVLKLYSDVLGYSDKDLMNIMHINQNDYVRWFNKRPKIIPIGIKTLYDQK